MRPGSAVQRLPKPVVERLRTAIARAVSYSLMRDLPEVKVIAVTVGLPLAGNRKRQNGFTNETPNPALFAALKLCREFTSFPCQDNS